ncbi:acyltransferase [Burkholderia vietnamiensis]|nr:acyltransferase [Burkholderia vietnamiensis]
MGTFRLLLALLVVASHTGVTVNGHNPGVFAVVSFFLMSGYVTTALVEKYYASVQRLPMFALDRAMRLFPQFLLYLGIGITFVSVFQIKDWNVSDLNAWSILLNAIMLPTGYYMYLLPHAIVLPPSWSLGLEFTFYAAIPFLIIYRLRGVACAASFAFFVYATAGYLDPDIFGYRLLPGTLFMFLAGSYIRTGHLRAAATIWTAAICLIAVWVMVPTYRIGYNLEVLSGFAVGLPAVWALSKLRFGATDELLGNISYGVYLNHYVLILAEKAMRIEVASWAHRIAFMCTSIILAYISYRLIEHPALMLRHRVRRNAMPTPMESIQPSTAGVRS